jgi:pyruvoyl-dependent arginine decarboxylase (PvlArgDC)
MIQLSGGMVVVNQGSVNDNKIFLCTTDSDGSIGSTNITYTVITPSNTGTVTSVGLTQSGTEFTIGSTPITSSGNITINVNRIAATKIGANTNVSDTEYGYLANVSSDIQTQIDAKATQGFATAMAIAL